LEKFTLTFSKAWKKCASRFPMLGKVVGAAMRCLQILRCGRVGQRVFLASGIIGLDREGAGGLCGRGLRV